MDHDFAYMGMRHTWGQDVHFGLHVEDRRHHTYVVGKTGSGKSTLLRNVILQDLAAGRGIGVIDPHGDLASELLDYIPSWRIDDVVYFNPADVEFPVGLNLLRPKSNQAKHLIASGLVSAFKNIWFDSWGPRTEWILTACITALLECENVSLLAIPRMLVNEQYREWVVRQVKDPIVRSVWRNEFRQYDKKFWQEATSPIQNKIGQLLITPIIRNILGQIRSRVDMTSIMSDRRIFIANLSKGGIGEQASSLLGAILVTAFQLAAMARSNVPEHERVDFQLVVDEFQNFTSDSFASILSECRKFRCSILLSHQFTAQLRQNIRESVFGNVGSLIAFCVGSEDAVLLAKEFNGVYLPKHLTQLDPYHVCAKLLENGRSGEPFFGATLPPIAEPCGYRNQVIARSREKYATSRKRVEDRIQRWFGG